MRGGARHAMSSTKPTSATPKSRGPCTVLVQTGLYSAAPKRPTAAALTPRIIACAPARLQKESQKGSPEHQLLLFPELPCQSVRAGPIGASCSVYTVNGSARWRSSIETEKDAGRGRSSLGEALLRGAQAGAFSLVAVRTIPLARAQTSPTETADYKIRIAPVSLEIAPGRVIKTTAYNATVPGPVLRLKEGRPVRIDVTNDSGYPNLIHSHGLMIPSLQDGATEEGSPIIEPGSSLTYSYIPKPSGTRWYHSHAMAMTDLNKSTYSGEFGFLIVDPAAGDPGSYDREVLLAAHHWEGHWVSLQDIKKGPPPDNGLAG